MAVLYRRLVDSLAEIEQLARSIGKAPVRDESGRRLRVTVERLTPNRTVEQNALMWVLLGCIAKQVPWPVNGQLVHLEPEDWKEILTAGLRKTQRVAQGVEGGFVLLGTSTSALDKHAMSELIEFLYFFGSTHNVDFGSDAKPAEQHPSAAPNHHAPGASV